MKIEVESRTEKRKRWLVGSLHSVPPQQRVQQREEQTVHTLSLAQFYHQNSKFYPDLSSIQMPMPHYAKPDYTLDCGLPIVELPDITDLPTPQVGLAEVLMKRRSNFFFEKGMTFTELAVILQLGAGVSTVVESGEGEHRYVVKNRTYPSGGVFYPVHVYLYAQQVEGLSRGLYRFEAFHNHLRICREGNWDEEVRRLFMGTDRHPNSILKGNEYQQASVYFFLAGDLRYQGDKYGSRAYRLLMLEAGHLAQNLLLISTAIDKSSVPLTGFYDDRLNALLQLDGQQEFALYVIPIG